MKTLISFRTLWLVSVICFLSVTSSPARADESGVVSKIIQADGFQLEAFVFGDGPVSLFMAAGNGRPAAQLDDLAKAISAKRNQGRDLQRICTALVPSLCLLATSMHTATRTVPVTVNSMNPIPIPLP